MNKTNLILKQLEVAPDAIDALIWPFDFEIIEDRKKSDWFKIKEVANHIVIARDGTGGEFAFVDIDDKELLLHVTSEGQAGILGESLEGFLGILLFCPYWRDLLKFSGNGQIEEMKRVIPFSIKEYAEDFTEIDSKRRNILNEINIQAPASPVTTLHKNIMGYEGKITVVGQDGWEFKSLFNSFTVESNPMWKKQIESA